MNKLISKQFTYHIFIARIIIQIFKKMFDASVERFNEYIDKNKVSHVKKGNYFEVLCLEIFRKLKFTARKSEAVVWNEEAQKVEVLGDNGIDIEADIVIQGVRILVKVQCKCYQNTKLKGEQIQAFDGVLSKYPNHVGVLMVYDRKMIEERYLTLIKNSVNPIYYCDVETIWNLTDDLTKDLEIYRKKPLIHPQQVTTIEKLPQQNAEIEKLKIKIDRETKITITRY
jgi:Restriction endonuclease